MALISINDLSFSYDGKPVFKHLSLNLPQGQMVGLIGPNGAGKSTLLRLLMRLVPIQRGEVLLMGKRVETYSRREIGRRITLVPQETEIGFAFTVEEIVAMGRFPHLGRFQPASNQDLAMVAEAMRETGVAALAHRPVNTLSGGERQRVLIARAIAQQTPIVLLDEATANLDLCHQLDVLERAKALTRQGRLVIAAIHDLTMASRFCDRVLLLADGGLQADGTPEQVLTPANLRKYFSLHASIKPQAEGHGLSITPLASIA